MRHGGQILIDQLKIQGVDRVFCLPGESYLAALDGLFESGIETIIGRQEGGVAIMAEAHGKLTGKPGVAFVTRGPGATNASAGVHIALQDSTPMILFVGQVASDQRDREAFQEVDYRQMFAPLAKWVAEIDRVDRIPEYISRAFHMAVSGRPGPVVLALPEDMLAQQCDVLDAKPAQPACQDVSEASVQKVLTQLQGAENPILIAGGGAWSAKAAKDLARFAAALHLPVATSFRCQDYIDNRHPNYAGDLGIAPNPALLSRVQSADCLLVLGARMGEMTTGGYGLLDIPNPSQTMIHIHSDANEIGRVYRPHLGLACTASQFLAQALKTLPAVPAAPQASPEHNVLSGVASPIRNPGGCAIRAGDLASFCNAFRRCYFNEWGGQLRRLAAPLFLLQSLSHATCAHFWKHGIWAARGGFGKISTSGARGCVPCRRWVFSNEHARVWNGGSIRRQYYRDCGE